MSKATFLKAAFGAAIVFTGLGFSGEAKAQEIPAPTGDLGRLQSLESQFFGHTNESYNIVDRLSKIESQVFGQSGSGALNGRLNRLEEALGKPTQAVSTVNQSTPSTSKLKPVSLKAAKPVMDDSDLTPTFSQRPPNAGSLTPISAESSGIANTGGKETFKSVSAAAVDDYKAQRYHACLEKLMKAVSLKPGDAVTYYRLGDVLTILQDEQGAKEAYTACFKFDPLGPVGRKAKEIILGYAKRDTYMQVAPQDSPQVVNHTVSMIDRQAADLSNRYQQDGQRTADFRLRLGAMEAQKIQNETNLALATARGGYGYYRSPTALGFGAGPGGGGYSAYDRQEISNLGRINSDWQRRDAQVQANKARLEAALKSGYVTESAANLKDLLLAPTLPGDAKLKALGTNLYVRYYGDETPSYDLPPVPEDPIQELKAKALQMKK